MMSYSVAEWGMRSNRGGQQEGNTTHDHNQLYLDNQHQQQNSRQVRSSSNNNSNNNNGRNNNNNNGRNNNNNGLSFNDNYPKWDYEVAELTWRNGQLAEHGFGPPKPSSSVVTSTTSTVNGHVANKLTSQGSGTLECIVSQSIRVPSRTNTTPALLDHVAQLRQPPPPQWHLSNSSINVVPTAAAASCGKRANPDMGSYRFVPHCIYKQFLGSEDKLQEADDHLDVGDHSTDKKRSKPTTNMVLINEAIDRDLMHDSNRSMTGSVTFSATTTSRSNTGLISAASLSLDDHGSILMAKEGQDSVCEDRGSKGDDDDYDDDEEGGEGMTRSRSKGRGGRSSTSTKRSRAAAVHNQSERKRRDKINQKMKTLQKMLPNSTKMDKASILDEVIEYLKQLQSTVQVMSRTSIPHMMIPTTSIQQLMMCMLTQMGMGMNMNMGMSSVMDQINPMMQSGHAGISPLHPNSKCSLPNLNPATMINAESIPTTGLSDPYAALLACQNQALNMGSDENGCFPAAVPATNIINIAYQ